MFRWCTLLFVMMLGMALMAQPSLDSTFNSNTLADIHLRSIGPAFSSGRIADIAVHPDHPHTWYVAVGSGGVWKTTNAGTTWASIFDGQAVYSIGCITIDPSNPSRIWVGTGENVGGRHVSFGDGIYLSEDGGSTWKNMGLKKSEHLSKIIVHPDDPNIIYVASQGPLWSSGGERGFYRSTDGGQTWTRTLGDEMWTGVTDIVIDPRDPDRVYAATWDRHRTIAAYMGGGPGTGLHRSDDGGQTWTQLKKGLPTSRMGKIGLGISPMQPDVLYAAIELDRRTGGVYRTADRGASWTKMSNEVARGTGPHYYQELYVSPHHFDRIYLADVRMRVSNDGGKTFKQMNERFKHSDNHALHFHHTDPDYLLVGTDGGLYETYDDTKHWRYINNMAITQYYKVAVDDAEPFYFIYGGTQDNNTHRGPSRTDYAHGMSHADWRIILGGDGHQPATEPGNPDICYAQWQQGNINRIDNRTGESIYIKPQPREGDPTERYNWDAPILVSQHDPKRLYFASQRLWRSDNRGDEWRPISGDLTKDENRIELPIMGKRQSYDNAWDVYAMSNYNTIANIAESPINEDRLYAGTDDGLIHVTADGGDSWERIEVGRLPGVPATSYVNDIRADLFDEMTVYACLDNHKFGDYKPYVMKSIDGGKTWRSITSNLPEKTLVWRIVQDHVDKDLLFLGTEFGLYVTIDGGDHWIQLKGGLPTISFRDVVIQRRENDLVAATFGRSFYVFDDYSFLRDIDVNIDDTDATLFAGRTADWYIPRPVLGYSQHQGYQGESHYIAKNPPFGATLTYYLRDSYSSMKSDRQKTENEQMKNDQDVTFPGWEALEAERQEAKTRVWLVVSDADGNAIRRLPAKATKGFHRITWNLRYPSYGIISDRTKEEDKGGGFMAAPGTYQAQLVLDEGGAVVPLSEIVSFEVEALHEANFIRQSAEEVAAFWRQLELAQQEQQAVAATLREQSTTLTKMQKALYRAHEAPGGLDARIREAHQEVKRLQRQLSGRSIKTTIGEPSEPNVGHRLWYARSGTQRSSYGPTPEHLSQFELAKKELAQIRLAVESISNHTLPDLYNGLREAGAPWISGQALPSAN